MNTTTKHTAFLCSLVVYACTFRFVMDGVSFSVHGETFTLGHMDSMAYISILTPVLAAHGFIKSKLDDVSQFAAIKKKEVDPDA
jgi:hypothetical protein